MTGKSSNEHRDPADHIYVVDHHYLMVASWHIATLAFGVERDGITEVPAQTLTECTREVMECAMQLIMREVFDGVHHFGRLGDHGTTANRIERAREFLRREVDDREVAEGAAGGS
jgi:hypothetical protein